MAASAPAGRPTSETHFSWLRSRMSAERTLMSYARGSISFIGLGFTIFEYLRLHQDARAAVAARGITSPEWLGLGLILAGIVLLIAGARDYASFVSDLRSEGYQEVSGIIGWRLRAGSVLMVSLLFIAAAFALTIVLTNL